MPKIPAIKIVITRAEGPSHLCDKPVTLTPTSTQNVWQQADQALLRWADTAPEKGGYDKCDFSITYEDGEPYEGRYDLVHWHKEMPSLGRHVRSWLSFHAGIQCPGWLTEKPNGEQEYRKIVDERPAMRDGCREFLNTHEIS